MLIYEPLVTPSGELTLVVAHDPDATTGPLAEGYCIAVFAGQDAFARAARYAAARQRGGSREA